MRMEVLGVFALGLLTAICGAERTATGGPGVGAAMPEASGSHGLADANAQAIDPSVRIRMAQSELKREGLYEGEVDGIARPAFTQGISEFQQLEGLQQTGRLDQATRNRMIVNALRMESVASARAHANHAAGALGTSSDP